MTWTVEIAYPAPISPELDNQLLELAERHGGQWSGSGCGVTERIPDRDIEFSFSDHTAAKQFADACCLLGVIRVVSVAEERSGSRSRVAAIQCDRRLSKWSFKEGQTLELLTFQVRWGTY